MIIFNILVDSRGEAFKFVDETRKNFFDSRPEVKAFIRDYQVKVLRLVNKEVLITGRVVSGLPPLYILGFLFLTIAIIFNAFFWLVPAFMFFLTGLLFTPLWYSLVFYVGLKKKGYKGRFKIITSAKALGVVRFGSE